MNDWELLQLAGKALGISVQEREWFGWNPLEYDNQCFEVMVELGIAVIPYPIYQEPKHSVMVMKYRMDSIDETNTIVVLQKFGEDQAAATRRAIVLCAAEIGKAMG